MKEEWDNQGQRQAQQHTQYREMKGEWDCHLQKYSELGRDDEISLLQP
jgi:hypothetical protein